MAELPADVKNRISHRARAAQAMRSVLAAELGL
jgi:inosine/xanthosine triphosphate pyrophosphatase family protein